MPRPRLEPLPAAVFQILLALMGEDQHGYGIMRQVRDQTGGSMRLGPGMLYSSILALLEEGLIVEVVTTEGVWRRTYRVTQAGHEAACAEAERLAGVLRVARARRLLRGDYV